MPTTTDGFFYPDTSYTSGFVAALAANASTVQTWANKRQLPDYLWANSAARTAQTGMVSGAEGFQADTKATYKYNGSAWKLWHTLEPVAFTPTWTNLTIGNGTQGATYMVAAGRCSVTGWLTAGSTTSVGSNPYMTVPLPMNGYITGAPNSGQERFLGGGKYADVGTNIYLTYIDTLNSSSVIYARIGIQNVGGSYAVGANIGSSTPFTITTGDYFNYDYNYMAD